MQDGKQTSEVKSNKNKDEGRERNPTVAVLLNPK